MKRFASEVPQKSRNTQLKSDQVHGFGVIQEEGSPANARPYAHQKVPGMRDQTGCCNMLPTPDIAFSRELTVWRQETLEKRRILAAFISLG